MKKNLFKGSVVLNPVPVVLITSRNSEGKENVFTVAWTGTICTKPPMLSISIRPDYCGVRSGRTNNKIEEMKFTMKEGREVKSPYIDECPVNIECKVKDIIPLGTHDLFLAEVLCSHIDSKLLDENEKIHFEWANLISYSHGEYFPMPKEAIGSFGYSVAKKKTIEKKAASKKTGAPSVKNKKTQTGKKKVKNK